VGRRFHLPALPEGAACLSFIIYVFSRAVVAWQLAGLMRTTLVLDALQMALGLRAPGADVASIAVPKPAGGCAQRCDRL